MVLFMGAVAASVAVVIALNSWAARSVNGHACGWMSEQWLAEQRLSRSA
jgi:hypothetical protein